MDEARRKGLVLDGPDIWAHQLWRLWGSMTNGPLEDEPWWQEWQRVRTEIERPLRAALSAAEARNQKLEAHVARLRGVMEEMRKNAAWLRHYQVIDAALSSIPADSLERLRKLEAVVKAARTTINSVKRGRGFRTDEIDEALSALDAELAKEDR